MTTKKIFPRTDSGNAELIVSLYGDKLRFDHRQSRWLLWREKKNRWEEDKRGEVRRLAKRAARYRARQATGISDHDESEKEFKWARGSENRYRIDEAIELAKSEPPISDDGEGWDVNPMLFGVANGVIDLRTGKFRAATQKDRITKFSPVAFDPDANCPRWEQFVREIFGDDAELIGFVQKAAGYTLTGSTKEQVLFACHGEGANGKSTFLEVLLHIFGDYGLDLPFGVLEAKHYGSAPGEGVNLPGARFAKAVETREGRQLDEGRIKSWTGGDTISVRPLYRNAFSFRPTHKLWLAFNHKPVIADDSHAMWRRIRLIPFRQRFEGTQRDPKLLGTLRREAPGILNWMIEGCLKWQKEGLEPPEAIREATSQYEAASDRFGDFLEDRCDIDASARVKKTDVWTAYRAYCGINQEKPMSLSVFKEKMLSRGFVEGKDPTGNERCWKGLRLRRQDSEQTTIDLRGMAEDTVEAAA